MALNLVFEVGDPVVHPQHGVGQVAQLVDRAFERGDTRRYYEIHISGGVIVWVPVSLPNSGLRKLASKSELNHCREILKGHPRPLTEDGQVRQSLLAERLKHGTIATQCEVVRDLSAFVAHKSSYGTITAFLEAMRQVLCQEWAIVEEISILDAMAEINALLENKSSPS